MNFEAEVTDTKKIALALVMVPTTVAIYGLILHKIIEFLLGGK